jgi:hypothetical protein
MSCFDEPDDNDSVACTNRQDANGTDGAGDGDGWWPGGGRERQPRRLAGFCRGCRICETVLRATFLARKKCRCLRHARRWNRQLRCLPATFNCKTLQVLSAFHCRKLLQFLAGRPRRHPLGLCLRLAWICLGRKAKAPTPAAISEATAVERPAKPEPLENPATASTANPKATGQPPMAEMEHQ